MIARLAATLAALLLGLTTVPAQAAVRIAFWSHDFGSGFPHAFFTLRGTPDAGGAAVDAGYGFTARSLSPAILFGDVKGQIERPRRGYMEGSHVHFSRTLTDAQYAAILELIRAWHDETGDATYNLNRRNCVTFVQEAARRSGIAVVGFPKLMKKPGRYLLTVATANAGTVTVVGQMGKAYLAALPPLEGVTPIDAAVSTPGTLPARSHEPRPAP